MTGKKRESLDQFTVKDIYQRPCIFNQYTHPDEFEKYREGTYYQRPDEIPAAQAQAMERWTKNYHQAVITLEYQSADSQLKVCEKINCIEASTNQLHKIKTNRALKLKPEDAAKVEYYLNQRLLQSKTDDLFASAASTFGERARDLPPQLDDLKQSYQSLSDHFSRVDYYRQHGLDPVEAMHREIVAYHLEVDREAAEIESIDIDGFAFTESAPVEALELAEQQLIEENYAAIAAGDKVVEHNITVALTAVTNWIDAQRDRPKSKSTADPADKGDLRQEIAIIHPLEGKISIRADDPRGLLYDAISLVDSGFCQSNPTDRQLLREWVEPHLMADYAELTQDGRNTPHCRAHHVTLAATSGPCHLSQKSDLASLKEADQMLTRGTAFTSDDERDRLADWIKQKEKQLPKVKSRPRSLLEKLRRREKESH